MEEAFQKFNTFACGNACAFGEDLKVVKSRCCYRYAPFFWLEYYRKAPLLPGEDFDGLGVVKEGVFINHYGVDVPEHCTADRL